MDSKAQKEALLYPAGVLAKGKGSHQQALPSASEEEGSFVALPPGLPAFLSSALLPVPGGSRGKGALGRVPSGCWPDLISGEPSWRDRVGERGKGGGRVEGGKEREVRGDGVSSLASCSSLLPGSPVGRCSSSGDPLSLGLWVAASPTLGTTLVFLHCVHAVVSSGSPRFRDSGRCQLFTVGTKTNTCWWICKWYIAAEAGFRLPVWLWLDLNS